MVDQAPVGEMKVPFTSFNDVMSLLTVEKIQASGTTRPPESIQGKLDKIRTTLDNASTQIRTGEPAQGAPYFLSGDINNKHEVILESCDGRASTAIVDQLCNQLGYKGELEDKQGYKPHNAIVKFSMGLENDKDVQVITMYQPLPLSPKITGKDGGTWQLARYQSRGMLNRPSFAGVSLIQLPKSS